MVQLNDFGLEDLSDDDFQKALNELIPIGEYVAIIESTDAKTTNDGEGKYIAVTFKIIDDKAKGRLVWDNLNLRNKNQKAVDIARARYAEICEAIGTHWTKVKDTSELHGKPVKIKVGIQKGKGGYNDSNNVKKVSKVSKKSFDENAPVMQSEGETTESAPWDS